MINLWYNAPLVVENVMQYGKIAIHGKGHSFWDNFVISKLSISHFIYLNYFHSTIPVTMFWNFKIFKYRSDSSQAQRSSISSITNLLYEIYSSDIYLNFIYFWLIYDWHILLSRCLAVLVLSCYLPH